MKYIIVPLNPSPYGILVFCDTLETVTGVRARSLLCADCGKAVCPKCGLETSTLPPGVSGQAITGVTNTSLTSSHKVMMTWRHRINGASDVFSGDGLALQDLR